MEEHRKWLETLLLDAEEFELIAKLAKLLPVIRMAEQMREMTADLKADIAAKRDCRSTRRPSGNDAREFTLCALTRLVRGLYRWSYLRNLI